MSKQLYWKFPSPSSDLWDPRSSDSQIGQNFVLKFKFLSKSDTDQEENQIEHLYSSNLITDAQSRDGTSLGLVSKARDKFYACAWDSSSHFKKSFK